MKDLAYAYNSTTTGQRSGTKSTRLRALQTIARYASLYALALTIGWIGALKFVHYEAAATAPFAQPSPLFSWAFQLLGEQGFSNALGVMELLIAGLLAMRPWNKTLAVIGGGLAVIMFLSTLSLMFSTPGVLMVNTPGVANGVVFGFIPALSPAPGQFLLKDAVLLGVALQVFADAITKRE